MADQIQTPKPPPSTFLQSPSVATGWRGVNLDKFPQSIPISDVQQMDNGWIYGGVIHTRPGKQGIFSSVFKIGGVTQALYGLTAFASADTSNPPNVTTWLIFVAGGRLWMTLTDPGSSPTEILLGGPGGQQFNINCGGGQPHLLVDGPYLYIVDGVGPLYRINIPYVNPTTAYTANEATALVPPASTFPATLTNQVVDSLSDATLWTSFPPLSWRNGTIAASLTPETVSNNTFDQGATGGGASSQPPPTGWLTGGDTMDFRGSITGVGKEGWFDPGAGPSWVDWDYPSPNYPPGTNTIKNARVYVATAYGHSGSNGGFSMFAFPEAASVTAQSFTTTITNATNANPIVITAAAHGLITGQSVTISGVTGNTAANGSWTVTVLTVNTFSIPIAGNGAYVSGGVATCFAPTTYTDLVIGTSGTSSTISSAAHPFQTTDVSKVLTIFSGTTGGWTLGNFTITAVNAGTHVATINGNAGVAAASGGIGELNLDGSTTAWGDHNTTLQVPPSALVGASQGSGNFTCSGANGKFQYTFSFSNLPTDFDYIKYRLQGPAGNPDTGVNTPSFKVVDVRLIIGPSATGTLHLQANNPVGVGANCLGGVWIKRDYTGTHVTYTDLAISGANTSQVTSAAHPFTSGDVGKTIQITGGTNWTVGIPVVLTVSGSVATLSSAAASSTTATGGQATSYSTQDYSQNSTISVKYSAPNTTPQIPFRFGFLQPGQPLTAVSWSNVVTYTADGSAFYCDVSTIAPAIRAQTGYLFLVIDSDLPATINPSDLCTLGAISTSGNLSINSFFGGLGGDYVYRYTEANAVNDSVFFNDVVESDPSPVSNPPAQPNGVTDEVQLIIPAATNPATTYYYIYRLGGVLLDSQFHLIARVPLASDIAFSAGSTVATYTDLVLVSGQGGAKVSSAGRTFISTDVGKILQVTAGTGFTPGSYPVSAVSGGVATLGTVLAGTSAGTAGSTGGSGKLIQPASTISWNHTTRTFIDNTPDSALIVNTPVFLLTGRTSAPRGCTSICSWQNRICLAKGSTVNLSWLTTAGNNTGLYFNTENVPDPNDVAQAIKGAQFPAGGINDPIQALVPMPSFIAVLKQRSIYLVAGQDAGSFVIAPHLLRAGTGAVAPQGNAIVNQRIWFLAADGVREYDGADVCVTKSKDIEPSLNPGCRNLPRYLPAATALSFMVYHGERLYLVCPRDPADTTPTQVWIWDPWSGGWTGPWLNWNMTSAASLTQSSNTDDLFWAGRDGQIYRQTGNGDKALSGSALSPVAMAFKSRAFGQESSGQGYYRQDRTNYVHFDAYSREPNVGITVGVESLGGQRGGNWSQTFNLVNQGQSGPRVPPSNDAYGMNLAVTLAVSTVTEFDILSVALETVDGSPGGP